MSRQRPRPNRRLAKESSKGRKAFLRSALVSAEPFTRQKKIITDEPGHQFLEYGVECGCGENGCIEAHISGSGIARKYGELAENIGPDDSRWVLIKKDVVAALDLTLTRYQIEGLSLKRLSFYGSVALKGPKMLEAISEGMTDTFIEAPEVAQAAYGENSGLFGAFYAARERISNN